MTSPWDATTPTGPIPRKLVSAADNDDVGDEMHGVTTVSNIGWPYTCYDGARHMRLTEAEYRSEQQERLRTPASMTRRPDRFFCAERIVPMDLTFYNGTKFPAKYRGGAFIPARGSNGPRLASGPGYNLLFIPMARNGDVKPAEFSLTALPAPRRRTDLPALPIVRRAPQLEPTALSMWGTPSPPASGVFSYGD